MCVSVPSRPSSPSLNATAVSDTTYNHGNEEANHVDGAGCHPISSVSAACMIWRKKKGIAPLCDEDLRHIGEEVSERYEYVPAQLLVIEDICQKYACACTV